jgi:hypothetical protein
MGVFNAGVDQPAEECDLRKKELVCLVKALLALQLNNKNGCNDKCIKAGQAVANWQSQTIAKDCMGK